MSLNPQSLNLYSYVFNNSVSGIDPTGHFHSIEKDLYALSLFAEEQARLQAQQQNAVQTAGQRAASGPYGSNVISVSGNTTTLPLYNGPTSSAEIIGTQVVTDNLNSNGSGTIKIVNTNQSIEGSPTETITMRLKNGLTQGISVRSSDGSVNMDSSTSFNSHTGQATVTTVNHNTNTVNVMVYDTAGGSGPVLRTNTTYNTTWVH